MGIIIKARTKLILQVLGTILGIFAIFGQLYLSIDNVHTDPRSYLSALIRYFSYMTIWTNILVTLSFFYPLLAPGTKLARFFNRPIVQTGLLLYIAIVSLVYHFFLSSAFNPTGLQYAVDVMLHYIVPFLYIFYWILYAKRGYLHYRNSIVWLTYPVIYVIYILTRGAITNSYPYPFLNVEKLGYSQVGANMLGLTLAYLVLGYFIVLLDKAIFNIRFRNKYD